MSNTIVWLLFHRLKEVTDGAIANLAPLLNPGIDCVAEMKAHENTREFVLVYCLGKAGK